MNENEINFTLNDVVSILKICHPKNNSVFCGSTESLMFQSGRSDMYEMFTDYLLKDISVEIKKKIWEEINYVTKQKLENQMITKFVFATASFNVFER